MLSLKKNQMIQILW